MSLVSINKDNRHSKKVKCLRLKKATQIGNYIPVKYDENEKTFLVNSGVYSLIARLNNSGQIFNANEIIERIFEYVLINTATDIPHDLITRIMRNLTITEGNVQVIQNMVDEIHTKIEPTPDDKDRVLMVLSNLIENRSVAKYDYRFKLNDGSYRWMRDEVELVRDEEGNPIEIIGSVMDINDRKEREEDLDNFFNLSLHILLIAGFDGTILRTNPGSKEILGHDENDLLGSNIVELIHPDDLEVTMLELKKLSEGGVSNHFENRIKRVDGSYRTLAWSAVPNLDKRNFYAIAYDITEQKIAENEIIESEKIWIPS